MSEHSLPSIPVKVQFRPQAWMRDYAVSVDPEGPTEWKDRVLADFIPTADREAFQAGDWIGEDDWSDQMKDSVAAPAWVREWSGPYQIVIQRRRNSNE